uniref:UDP-glucuronosyltransferase n=1 Tax=Panagrellus redivivus TaxID=6233 RepID=A0A7E4W1M3_PANRE
MFIQLPGTVLVLFISVFHHSHGYRFLVASYHDSGSHQSSLSKIFVELARRGNEVIVLDSTSKEPQYYHPNVKVVYVPTSFDEKYRSSYLGFVWRTNPGVTATWYGFQSSDVFLGLLIEEQPEKITDVLNTHFDAVIVDDIFATHAMWIADWLKARKNTPYVLYGTSTMLDLYHFSAGHMRHPLSHPIVPGPVLDDPADAYAPGRSLKNRLVLMYSMLEPLNLYFFGSDAVRNLRKLGSEKFQFSDFYANAAFGFSETFDRFGISYSQTSDFRGTGANCVTIKPTIPPELLQFIEESHSNGTIIVALGSNAKWIQAPEYIKTAFWGALRQFTTYRTVFTYDDVPPPDVPSHIKVMKWAPQTALLQHPSVKLFLSHAGLKSLNEAICAGVPLVVMPLFAEQQYNAKMLVALGHAVSINKYTLTEEKLFTTLWTMLNDNWSVKKAKAVRLGQVYADRYMPSVTEAAFFIERVAKTNGNRASFKKGSSKLYFSTLLGLDWLMVIGALISIVFLS